MTEEELDYLHHLRRWAKMAVKDLESSKDNTLSDDEKLDLISLMHHAVENISRML